MDNGWGNIDLLFRNGLKDYEVLPPPEVWNKIRPSIKSKSKALILLRVAAVFAGITAISFLTYQLTREVPPGIPGSFTAFDIEASTPSKPFLKYAAALAKKETHDILPVKSLPEETVEVTGPAMNDQVISPEITKENIKTSASSSLYRKPVLPGLRLSEKKSFEIPATQQYIPFIDPVKNVERWSIAAMASPTYYSQFSSNGSKQLSSSEQPLVSYSGGLAVSYKINKRFSVQTGLYYSSLGQRVDGVSSFSGFRPFSNTKGDHNFEVLTTSGSVYTTNGDIFLAGTGPDEKIRTAYTNDVFDPKKASLSYLSNSLIQNFSYLELPVVLKYKLIDRTIDFNLIGGLSYSLLVNNSAYAKVDGNKYSVGDTKGLNPLTLSSSLGMGMEYNVSKKISLSFEPTFKYYLNPFNTVSGTNGHPYFFGVYSGFSYRF
jgi:hypothetical protein